MQRRDGSPVPPTIINVWSVGWVILAPLALWLLFDKSSKVLSASAWAGSMPDSDDFVSTVRWLSSLKLFRLVFALFAGYLIQRIVFPGRRWTAPLIGVSIIVLAVLGVSVAHRDSPLATLSHWLEGAAPLGWMLLVCLWRDAVCVALLAMGISTLLAVSPASARWFIVRSVQWGSVLICLAVGIEWTYELATGQPLSFRIVLLGARHPMEFLPMVRAETTPFRVFALIGGSVLAMWWGWHWRWLASASLQRVPKLSAATLGGALGLAAWVAPVPALGFVEAERHTEGTLHALYKSALPSLSDELRDEAQLAYQRTGNARWHNTEMALEPTDRARAANVVIVMMESIRASSTTMHRSELATMPYLQKLANSGMWIDDMNAVIPRTTAAWHAILTGLYPLTNEETHVWAKENAKAERPRKTRSLVSAMGEIGYSTAFFTPTHLDLLDDSYVIEAMGFDRVSTMKDILRPGVEKANYLGVADDLIVEPLLEWASSQSRNGKPSLTVYMTNVGHHAYETPDSWKKIDFPNVTKPILNDYYNCLRYIDSVLETLVTGYERLGLLDNTIFVILGDHGQMFGEHGLKQTFNAIYQDGIHVPAVIYAPGLIKEGVKVSGPRQQIDILPTLADLLGYRVVDAELPGISLLADVDASRALFFSSSIDWSFLAMRKGPRKYIYDYDRSPLEIYDLASDPGEARPLQASTLERNEIRTQLLRWKIDTALAMYGVPSASYRVRRSWKMEDPAAD